jgi:hypothetical protein
LPDRDRNRLLAGQAGGDDRLAAELGADLGRAREALDKSAFRAAERV